jgi:hypothetical protein
MGLGSKEGKAGIYRILLLNTQLYIPCQTSFSDRVHNDLFLQNSFTSTVAVVRNVLLTLCH